MRLRATDYHADVIPVRLGLGRTVYLHGVPADLSTAEAQKISRVLSALADDDACIGSEPNERGEEG